MHQIRLSIFCVVPLLLGAPCHARFQPASSPVPKGLMLNLDFQNVQDGLIPNKAFFPLYVPQCDAGIETLLQEQMLVVSSDPRTTATAGSQ